MPCTCHAPAPLARRRRRPLPSGPPVARRVAYRYGGQIKASESRRPLPPCGDRRLVPLGRAAGRDLHAPPDPVQQHIKPGQRVIHPEPLAHQFADPAQRPALNAPSPRRPAPRPSPPPARATGPGSTCTGPRPPPWRPALVSRRRPAPAATGSPTSATPGTVSRPPVARADPDQLRRCQPHSSRRTLSCAVNPPPSRYLMVPA